jgi:CBS domain-containing protein
MSDSILREVPLLTEGQPLRECVNAIMDAGVPALPVVDAEGRLIGIFGEREFISALFPGYVGELSSAAFVRRAIDDALERRAGCLDQEVSQHVNREHVDVGPDHSDVQLAEIFLHHRVLIVPVADARRVLGIVARSDFFAALVARLDRR